MAAVVVVAVVVVYGLTAWWVWAATVACMFGTGLTDLGVTMGTGRP